MSVSLPLISGSAADVTIEQDGGGVIRRSVLPGGVRVLTERMPGQRAVTVGAWIGVGSRDETDGHFGSTHFLEHLLFKGTRRRSALDIAETFDAVGGEANAATGKEHTCYYARVLDADLPMAIDVICDMITSARIDPSDLETERSVILEELAMTEDDPSDVVHETFSALVYGNNPLGRPIGGTPATIRAVPRDAVWEHYRQHYGPQTLVVTAAGNIEHDVVCALVLDALANGGWTLTEAAAPGPRRPVEPGVSAADIPAVGSAKTVRRPVEQANVIIGGTGIGANDDRRFILSVLSAVFGGGMSSRLFQEVRERRGLAYSVYSFGSTHADAGTFGLYAGCNPGRVEDVASLLAAEWDRLANDGITAAELRRGIGQLSGGLVLGLEDSGSRMSRLGKAELVHGELMTVDESLAKLSAVTTADVQTLAQELFERPRSQAVVGPFDEPEPVTA